MWQAQCFDLGMVLRGKVTFGAVGWHPRKTSPGPMTEPTAQARKVAALCTEHLLFPGNSAEHFQRTVQFNRQDNSSREMPLSPRHR